MDIADLIAPWLSLLLILIPLIYAEKWIHQHLFGVSYLITDDKETATGIYYIFFFPGVFLHEVIQYLVAGALNVPINKIQPTPKAQDNGTLRFDFVSIKSTDPVRASIIGGVPFLIAGFLVYTISTSVLDLHSIVNALGAQSSTTTTSAFQDLFNTPNFWFWLYILFVISNGMIPTKEDRQGWWLIFAIIGGLTIILLAIGSHQVVTDTLAGPVRESLQLVNTSLAIILGLDIVVIVILRTVENIFERIRGYRVNYHTGEKKKSSSKSAKRPAGSNIPIPKGELMPSIYNLNLPIPALPPKRSAARTIQQAASDVASGRPQTATDAPALATSSRVPPSGTARTTAEMTTVPSSSDTERTPAAATPSLRSPTSESADSAPASRPPARPLPSNIQPSAEGATESLRPSFSRPSTPPAPEASPAAATSSLRRPMSDSNDSPPSSPASPRRPLSDTQPTTEGATERLRPSFSRPNASTSPPTNRSTSDPDTPASPRQSLLNRGATPERISSLGSPRRTFGSPDEDDKETANTASDAPARPTGRTSPLSPLSRDRSALSRRSSDSDGTVSPDRPRTPFNRSSDQQSSRLPLSRQPSPPNDEDEAEDDIEYVDFDDA
jgi:hypothetical protein